MKQKLKFKELYTQSRDEIKETLVSMWTRGSKGSNGYEKDMADAVEKIFAPQDSMPIVQSMFTWKHMDNIDSLRGDAKKKVTEEAIEKARKLVEWETDKYAPFEHQYECWDALLNKNKSICVTTGTGSGKTECFMLPIVKKISQATDGSGVRAIMLYPLNALAEDQKRRLEEYLEQVDPSDSQGNNKIKFAVYNGNTDEYADDGTVGTLDNGETYKHELKTRKEIRENPPAILVTNPTMLEYIMLRDKDVNLLGNNLEWFVIDETHTFKGAAAAELAMLIRRVILASGIDDPKKVQFATSSATTGTGSDDELKKFIADISGRKPEDIEIIGGERVIEEEKFDTNRNLSISVERQREIAKTLLEKDYIRLDELIHDEEGLSIEDKLAILDELCDEGNGINMMAKVLYFFQAPSRGLSTQLDDLTDEGRFKIINKHKNEDGRAPYVELVRCTKCGSVLAQAQVEETDKESVFRYNRRKFEKVDSFDIVSDPTDLQDFDDADDFSDDNGTHKKEFKTWLFAPAKNGNGTCYTEKNTNLIYVGAEGEYVGQEDRKLNLRHSEEMKCPCCNGFVIKNKDVQTNEGHDGDGIKAAYLRPFAVSPMFLSRTLSRVFLNQMTENEEEKPHMGQQYISFVDNRQGAAKLTLEQAKDLEEQWLQSRVYKILSECHESLNWTELYYKLKKDYSSEIEQLVKQSLTSKEQLDHGDIDEYKKIQYIMTLMYEHIGSRKPTKDSLETLGMIKTHYPVLEDLQWSEIADRNALSLFNKNYCGGKITSEDWKNFIQMYIDYQLRTDASVYCDYRNEVTKGDKAGVWNDISVTRFRRFATRQDSRRPAQPLKLTGRFGKLLCAVAGWNNVTAFRGDFINLSNDKKDALNSVLEDVFKLLADCGILQNSTGYIKKDGKWDNESADAWRLDLDKIEFKLCDKAFLCPITNKILPYTFMGYSPYMDKMPVKAKEIEHWATFNFDCKNENEVKKWCLSNRKELGDISNKTARLFLPKLPVFVSAEHTAQVDKDLLKEHQIEFKNHEINILTCSTTMEMGVDLGDLELVVMNSIPPHPANYKQRAGRSGRKSQNKSAAVTLCGNDSVGKQTMDNSLDYLISRSYSTPFVDFNSSQIIQRHINSYLLRECDVELKDKVVDMFAESSFEINKNNSPKVVIKTDDNGVLTCVPSFGLGDKEMSVYNKVINEWTNNPDLYNGKIRELLKNICAEYLGQEDFFRHSALSMLKNLYAELNSEFEKLKSDWDNKLISANKNINDARILNDNKTNVEKAARRINYRYVELMDKPLLSYLSTHQFTPNAAMPVCIIEFDTQQESRWSRKRRPSYTLDRALTQYAPGKLVVLNNGCYRSAGVDWRGRFSDSVRGIRYLTQEGDELKVVNQGGDSTKYELMTPTSFKTDINQEENRITDGDIYTRTEAFLINKGAQHNTASNLIKRCVAQANTTPEILYINTGKNRMGYCVCLRCGRADIETQWGTNNGHPTPPPASFLISSDRGVLTMRDPQTRQDIPFHRNISINSVSKKTVGKDDRCINKDLKRNVVFGDTIQTDYCELKLFHASSERAKEFKPDSNSHNTDYQILHTLGMLICADMSENLGIERGEISYLLTTAGSLCIYDLAKGGAGYSKRLMDDKVLLGCLDRIRKKVSRTNEHGELVFTADMMIDSFTVFNEDFINLDETRRWLLAEESSREEMPSEISEIDKNAFYVEGLRTIIQEEMSKNKELTLYADWYSLGKNDYEAFKGVNYKYWYKECLPDNTRLCFFNFDNERTPSYDFLKICQEHASLHKLININLPKGVYPLAKIGDKLFVTNDANVTQLNAFWGDCHIYCIDAEKVSEKTNELKVKEPSYVSKFIIPKGLDIYSSELLGILESSNDNVKSFFDKHQGDSIHITYEDQYLMSPFSLSIAVQVLKSAITRCNAKQATVKIEMEEFVNRGKSGGIMYNLPDSIQRDEFLGNLCDGLEWGDFINTCPEKALPHWRVLAIVAGDEILAIYPNGGFHYGWGISPTSSEYYAVDRLTHDVDIKIKLKEDIMFDVQIVKL